MTTLSIRGLTRRFGPRVIFEDVTFDVAAGTATALLGPNGAGKSTLLRCVVAADVPDAGEVLFEGRAFDETDPGLRAAVATVLDDVEFFPDLSAIEHLHLLARAHGDTGDSVEAVLTELGLGPARDQLPSTLSSGQRRRLALASCFVRPRRLLLLDEPEQRLDVRGRQWLTERLHREKASGTAILLASHDPDLVAAVADQRIELGAAPLP